jgi:hypothetical protein
LESDKPQISRDGEKNYWMLLCGFNFSTIYPFHICSAHVAWSTKKERKQTKLDLELWPVATTSNGHEEFHLVAESRQPSEHASGKRRSDDKPSAVGKFDQAFYLIW